MGMRKVNIIYVVCVLLCCLGLPACKKNIGLTTVSVADSVRHYYPLIAGQVLNLSYEIENTGDQPLIIRDIQSSCGCIVPLLKQGERMVLPERKARLRFSMRVRRISVTYNTSYGYMVIYIRMAW